MTPDIRVPHWADEEHKGFDGAWHRAVNEYEAPFAAGRDVRADRDGKDFMYQARHAAHEVPRLALLFRREREGKLGTVHKQCSHDHAGTPVPDNHLTCCLGVECRKCPHLAALDAVQTRRTFTRTGIEEGTGIPIIEPVDHPIPAEQRDVLKAWTCVTHILMRGGDHAGEGYVMTVDDRMYWENVYSSLAGGPI